VGLERDEQLVERESVNRVQVLLQNVTVEIALKAGARRGSIADLTHSWWSSGAAPDVANRTVVHVAFVLFYRAPNAPDPRLLYDLGFGLLAMTGVPTALALDSYAGHVLRDSRLPGWTGWIAVVAALAHIVLLASLVIASGFFSLEGGVIIAIPAILFAWILGTSMVLLRTPIKGDDELVADC
jgi:hypothetical protein